MRNLKGNHASFAWVQRVKDGQNVVFNAHRVDSQAVWKEQRSLPSYNCLGWTSWRTSVAVQPSLDICWGGHKPHNLKVIYPKAGHRESRFVKVYPKTHVRTCVCGSLDTWNSPSSLLWNADTLAWFKLCGNIWAWLRQWRRGWSAQRKPRPKKQWGIHHALPVTLSRPLSETNPNRASQMCRPAKTPLPKPPWVAQCLWSGFWALCGAQLTWQAKRRRKGLSRELVTTNSPCHVQLFAFLTSEIRLTSLITTGFGFSIFVPHSCPLALRGVQKQCCKSEIHALNWTQLQVRASCTWNVLGWNVFSSRQGLWPFDLHPFPRKIPAPPHGLWNPGSTIKSCALCS